MRKNIVKMFNEITLKTSDNVIIKANHYNNNKDTIIVIALGWCMTKDSNAFKQIAEFFSNYYDIISFDFRGHGKSGGFYTFGAKEIKDLDCIINYLKNYNNIYLMGYSLGAMVILNYMAKYADNNKISKAIAVSAPSDFSKIENQMYKIEAWGETFKKFELIRFLTIRPSIIPHKKIKPIDVIEKVKVPTLFIAGKLDPTVHFWHTEKLYQKATCKKEYKLFEKGIHAEDIFLHFQDEFTKICLDWLV